jgi:hypothetical protein
MMTSVISSCAAALSWIYPSRSLGFIYLFFELSPATLSPICT